jgi:sugar-specific transcriptional regulator TrmB
MDLQKILEEQGIEEKSAKVYLALLKHGESTATKISEKTGIDRTLIYQLTNKLIGLGMVSYAIKNNVKYFYAASPEKLLSDLKEKEKRLQRAIPDFMNLLKTKEEDTTVEMYRGKEGLRTVIKDIITTKQDYIAFGEEGRSQEVLPIDVKKFLRQLEKNNIHERVLIREDMRGKILKSKNSIFRFIPEEYLSPITIIVYGNKTAIFIWSSPHFVILTRNMDVAESLKNYFELLWKIAKK